MVRAYWLAVEKAQPGEVYNIATGNGIHHPRAARQADRALDAEVTIEADPDRLRPSDVEILIGDSSKFRADTGWEPRVPSTRRSRHARLLAGWTRPQATERRATERSRAPLDHRHLRLRRRPPRPLARRARRPGERRLLADRPRPRPGALLGGGPARPPGAGAAIDASQPTPSSTSARCPTSAPPGSAWATTSGSTCWAPRTCWPWRPSRRAAGVVRLQRRGLRHGARGRATSARTRLPAPARPTP